MSFRAPTKPAFRHHLPTREERPADRAAQDGGLDVEEAVDVLLRDLRSSFEGLSSAEAVTLDMAQLVPGDIILIEEGERVPADVRLIEGSLEIDMSALTGESQPVERSADAFDAGVPKLQARGWRSWDRRVSRGRRAASWSPPACTRSSAVSRRCRSASRSRRARSADEDSANALADRLRDETPRRRACRAPGTPEARRVPRTGRL
jgi:hypothetical protein